MTDNQNAEFAMVLSARTALDNPYSRQLILSYPIKMFD